MKTYYIIGIVITALCFNFTACGGRSLPGSDGAAASDGAATSDGAAKAPDAKCKRPANGCFSTSDCPAGMKCEGCGADPCCPMCAVCYGKCVPSKGGCKDNGDCAKSEYCHIDTGCKVTGAKMGTCTARPKSCTFFYDPVCGCDGKTHGNPCAAHKAGVNVAAKGKCQSCSELSQAFAAAVVKAKACSPAWSKISCTLKTKSNLGCPCPTFVEDSNSAALKEMAEVEQLWKKQGCKQWPCGMTCGPPPKGAFCLGRSATGVCTDKNK